MLTSIIYCLGRTRAKTMNQNKSMLYLAWFLTTAWFQWAAGLFIRWNSPEPSLNKYSHLVRNVFVFKSIMCMSVCMHAQHNLFHNIQNLLVSRWVNSNLSMQNTETSKQNAKTLKLNICLRILNFNNLKIFIFFLLWLPNRHCVHIKDFVG